MNVARNGNRAWTVSATSARSGRASGRLIVAGSIVAISAALYRHNKSLSRDRVLRSALHKLPSTNRADHRPGGIGDPIRPRGRAKRHEGLMYFVRRAVQGCNRNGEQDGGVCSIQSCRSAEGSIAEDGQHAVFNGMQQFVAECFEEKFRQLFLGIGQRGKIENEPHIQHHREPRSHPVACRTFDGRHRGFLHFPPLIAR